MTGRFALLSSALLVAACATAKDVPDAGGGDPIDAAGDPIDGPPGAPDASPACSPNGSTMPCYTGTVGTAGTGPCVEGTRTCVDGEWASACVGEVTPTTETCDTVDNDCDGTPDDGNPGGGGACSTGLTGICAAGVNQCSGGNVACVQTNQPAAELCNGMDDDCNAGTADGNTETWFNQPCDGTDLDACNEGTNSCNGTSQVCGDVTGDSNRVVDGGFEAAGAPAWTQSSTNFGTPLCNVQPFPAGCGGTGGGTGPRSGAWWNWLGGTTAAETAFVTQAMTIPVGTATLTFYFEIPACGTGGAAETFSARIDGTNIYSTTNGDGACGVVGYTLKTFNVSAYANGGSHTLEFHGAFNAGQAGVTNFMVDDVRLVSCP